MGMGLTHLESTPKVILDTFDSWNLWRFMTFLTIDTKSSNIRYNDPSIKSDIICKYCDVLYLYIVFLHFYISDLSWAYQLCRPLLPGVKTALPTPFCQQQAYDNTNIILIICSDRSSCCGDAPLSSQSVFIFWAFMINATSGWFMLIGADWCWLMLIDSD